MPIGNILLCDSVVEILAIMYASMLKDSPESLNRTD